MHEYKAKISQFHSVMITALKCVILIFSPLNLSILCFRKKVQVEILNSISEPKFAAQQLVLQP